VSIAILKPISFILTENMPEKNLPKIEVLLVTHYYPEHRGGVEIVAGKLTEFLLKNYPLEIIWLASNTDLPPTHVSGLQCLPVKANNFIEKKLGLPYPLWNLPSFFKLWQLIKNRDIVHLHDYLYFSNLLAFIFAKLQKKPIVITQHIGFIPYNNPLFRNLLSFLNNTLGCFMLKHSSQVVFISETVQKYFTLKTRLKTPSLMIPNGVDLEMFYPTEDAQRKLIRQELKLPLEKLLFLFVGRFVEKKGLLILQKLASYFTDIHWIFAGWGVINPQSWNLPNVIVFSDRRGSQLTPLYQTADLFVLPSKGEGFPLVVQEAMACGTPVLIGRETAEGYSQAKSLMFYEEVEGKNTFPKWLKKVAEIRENKSILGELRPKVSQFAANHWSWTHCAQQYFNLLQNLST
jgi:glycosyltransferase involved in cell wall biosynthesis